MTWNLRTLDEIKNVSDAIRYIIGRMSPMIPEGAEKSAYLDGLHTAINALEIGIGAAPEVDSLILPAARSSRTCLYTGMPLGDPRPLKEGYTICEYTGTPKLIHPTRR